MCAKKVTAKASTQYIEGVAIDRLERLAGRLGVSQGRVLDSLLSARTDDEVCSFIKAEQYRRDATQPVPVLLDGAVVAAMSGAITQSVSTLLGSALPDLLLAVLASQAERRPQILNGAIEPILDRLVPIVLDRLIAEQLRAEGEYP